MKRTSRMLYFLQNTYFISFLLALLNAFNFEYIKMQVLSSGSALDQ